MDKISKARKKFEDWLGRITYKPNVRIIFSNALSDDGFLRIVVFAKVVDSRDRKSQIKVSHIKTISVEYFELFDFEAFVHWIKDILFQIEKHEFDEFFCVDGKVLSNPHLERFYG